MVCVLSVNVTLLDVGAKLSTEAESLGVRLRRSSSSVILSCRTAKSPVEGVGWGDSLYSQARSVRVQRPHAGKPLSHLRLCFLQGLQA